MYIPNIYKNVDKDAIHSFIKENGFATLVNQVQGRSWATHIPIEITQDQNGNDVLYGHIAKANPQGNNFKEEGEVLVIFQGPHSYISSSWYNYEEVPTWNYIAVHLYGKIKIIEGDELFHSINSLVDKYEANSKNPISLEQMSEKTLKKMKGIIGFKILITEIQGKRKLSQNKDEENYNNVINQLNQSTDKGAQEIAKCMKHLKNKEN